MKVTLDPVVFRGFEQDFLVNTEHLKFSDLPVDGHGGAVRGNGRARRQAQRQVSQ